MSRRRLGLVKGLRDSATGQFLIYGESPLERIAKKSVRNKSKLALLQNKERRS